MTEGSVSRVHLLTGPPRSGKSTALAAAVSRLRGHGVRLGGFYTSEIRSSDGERAGFDVVSVATGTSTALARRTWTTAPDQVGSYGVNPDALTLPLTELATEPVDVVVLDEIGRMQLLHPRFADHVTAWLDSDVRVLGTVHVFDDPVTDQVKARPDVTLHAVDDENRDALPALLAALLRGSV